MMASVLAWSPDSVWLLLQKTWWFLVVLGILVAFHELGHFLAARWVGVKVLKFSLGFGPKLLGRQVGETEYLVSAIPLGGYVKLFGEEETEAITPEDRRRSFSHQSLWGKVLIVSAGPGFNFILAYLIFAAWLATGYTLPVPSFKDIAPVLEAVAPDSPAAKAGLMVGDQIKKIDGRDIATRVELLDAAAKGKGAPLTLEVLRDGRIKPSRSRRFRRRRRLNGTTTQAITWGSKRFHRSSMKWYQANLLPLRIQEGDRVLSIDGRTIHTWTQMTGLVKDSPGKTLQVDVLRDGHRVSLSVTPLAESATVNGQAVQVGKIGIAGPDRSLMRSANPLMAVYNGLEATWKWTELTIVGLYKMIVGDISSKNIGGPLTIAKISGEAAAQGPANVILIALLSINLGVLNLLPIPILDGGHLLFFLIEGILRKPLGERQRELAQQVGLVLLVGVMIFAFWNDLERIFFSH